MELVVQFPPQVPVQFVNGLRRILVGEMPQLVVGNVKFAKNTSRLTHDVVAQQLRQLPVKVLANTPKWELLSLTLHVVAERPRMVTSTDFGAPDILLPGFPIVELQKGEELSLEASLEHVDNGSLCCGNTSLRIRAPEDDPVYAAEKKAWLEANPKQEQLWENFHSQIAAQKAAAPFYELHVQSEGIVPARQLLFMAAQQLKNRISRWFLDAGAQAGTGRITAPKDATVGYLVQRVLVQLGHTAAYDEPHPLKPDSVLTVIAKDGLTAHAALESAQQTIAGYFDGME